VKSLLHRALKNLRRFGLIMTNHDLLIDKLGRDMRPVKHRRPAGGF
jgi:hypothetical protein